MSESPSKDPAHPAVTRSIGFKINSTDCRLIAQQTDAHELFQNFDVGFAEQDSCGVQEQGKGGWINYVVSIISVLPSESLYFNFDIPFSLTFGS